MALIDPGNESADRLWTDLETISRGTGKSLAWILITHSHPDHIANLPFLVQRAPNVRIVAHGQGPLSPHRPITEPTGLPVGPGVRAIPVPGHADARDDLAFWVPSLRALFSGDAVQPKGETWAQAFYPSPYPYFTDGDLYIQSLEALRILPVSLLVTGHREVREEQEARRWIELTIRAIRRVEEAVVEWDGPEDLGVAGPAIFRLLCAERGIPDNVVYKRLESSGKGPSAFERFDLPGIAWFWHKHGRGGF